MYNKNNYQLVKDLRKDVEENIVKYEVILSYLEGVYSDIKELTKNFKVTEETMSTMRAT